MDNRKQNLQQCTKSLKNHNTKIDKRNTSGFRGVYFDKRPKRWYARITYESKTYHLGGFDIAQEASIAYNKKALELFGQFIQDNAGTIS